MSGSSILSKQAPYTANSYSQIAKHSRIKSRDYLLGVRLMVTQKLFSSLQAPEES